MEKITKKELLNLGFIEYEPNYFSLSNDLGTLEYHLKENKIVFGEVKEKLRSLEHLKLCKESMEKFALDLICGEK